MDAGTGNDEVTTRDGSDAVDLGPGLDIASTGDADDTISALDGATDQIDCGSGIDAVSADASDVVATSCEYIFQRWPSATPSTGDTGQRAAALKKCKKKRHRAAQVAKKMQAQEGSDTAHPMTPLPEGEPMLSRTKTASLRGIRAHA